MTQPYKYRLTLLASLALLLPTACLADTISTQSYTGTLETSDSVFETTVTLAAGDDVLLQTYGFGGGTNAASTAIPAGGTDPFLAIFNPTGDILTDGMGNPYGTSLDLSNYSSFAGCPPAGTVNIGGSTCGDITMAINDLAAGTYTIALSDGLYIANAVFDNGNLSEGFADEFTGGQFCNLDINGVACPNTSGAYALDVTTISHTVATPEPAILPLLALGLLGLGAVRTFRGHLRGQFRNAPHFG
jgi:hypothetical protein